MKGTCKQWSVGGRSWSKGRLRIGNQSETRDTRIQPAQTPCGNQTSYLLSPIVQQQHFSHLYLHIWEIWRGLNGDLRKQEAFWPRQKLWQAPSSLPPSCTPSSISAATRAVVPKREEGVEEGEGRLDMGEVRLSAWLLHFRGFGGTMARLCGFELEKLLSLSGLLCSPSFVT